MNERPRGYLRTIPIWYLPVMIVVALGTAYLGELITNAYKNRFFTPEGLPPFSPALLREIMWNNIYNHSICYGFLGAVTCGLLTMITAGLAGPGRAITGFVVGSTLGLVGGVATGVLGYFVTAKLQPMNIESILMAMLVFAPVWGMLGAITSMTSVMLLGRSDLIVRALQMTLAMTLCTIVVYPLLVTMAFPSDWPGRIIPEFPRTRLACFGIGSVGMALALFLTLRNLNPAANRTENQESEPAS